MRYSEYKRKRKKKKRWLAVLIIVLLLAVLALGWLVLFQLEEIEITGNERYDEQQILAEVRPEAWWQNTIYMYLKYRYQDTEEIPFIDQVEVKIAGPGKIRMHVYEKGIVGCVQYLEKYMYFDREGIVVYSSAEEEGVTMVMGLSFSEITLYQKLPVEDDTIFRTLLDLTQNLEKNDLAPDIIYLSDDDEITLYFEDVEVLLGTDRNMEEKVNQLPEILPDLYGKAGVLHMENYSESSTTITFDKK